MFLTRLIHPNGFELRKMSAFIQKLNNITGQNDWVIQNEDYDYHQEVARAAFADMLHDGERNVMYEQALKIAIDRMHSNGRQANVLDIGTGTGLLSMMAVRHGADSVVACEAFKPMGQCALEVIKLNGCSDRIKLIPKRSTDLKIGIDLDFRANILVTEVFDTELIGEGALSTFKHAHDVLLEKDCIVVPHSGTIYAQIVESPIINNWNRIKDVYNEDGEIILKSPQNIKTCRGSSGLHDLQLSQFPIEFMRSLASPQIVLKFDWSGKTALIEERNSAVRIKAERDGTAQAVFVWWDLNMDVDNGIILSCAPKWAHPLNGAKIPWRDHWMQAVYYFPQEMEMKKGAEYDLISCHDEYSLWFDVQQSDSKTAIYDSPRCKCNLHVAYSRTRIGQMNDHARLKRYLNCIESSVKADSVVLILSHGFYTALTSAKTARKVYCYEPNPLSRGLIKDFIAVNELINVQVLDHVPVELNDAIDVVLGEPYFVSSILPWDNLLFLYLLKEFGKFFKESVKVFPAKAIVKAVAVEFDDLHRIRAPLGTCREFLMEPFDKLIEHSSDISDENVEAQPLWEYPGKALTAIQDIAGIDLQIYEPGFTCETSGTFILPDSSKQCNGIALWIDWILDAENARKSTVTTGPTRPFEIGDYINWDMHTRQAVCLLGHKKIATDRINYKFKYCYDNGNVAFKLE